jgi:hypothetical protein
MLSEASLVGVGSDTLRVSCPDDFHLDQLARNRQFIADLAQNIYGARVRLETILAKAQSQASAPQGADASPLPVPVPGGAAEQASSSAPHAHPVIQALIREFGAKEV